MTKICVTGAAGRIGSLLVKELHATGTDVRCVVRPGGRNLTASTGFEIVEADLTDSAALHESVAGSDVVIHLAAQMPLGETSVEQYYDINVMGTLRLLEAASQQSQPVKQFIYASSDNTYGPGNPGMRNFSEEHTCNPGDYYGTAKLLGEDLVRNYALIRGLDYTILRYGSVLGPDEAPPLFRLSWLRAFLEAHQSAGPRSNLWPLFATGHDFASFLPGFRGDEDPATAVLGPGDETWSLHLTDVRDAVDGTLRCVGRRAAVNQTFNIVGPHTTTFADGAAAAARHMRLPKITVRMPETLAFEVSHAKAEQLLGYRPRHDFPSTLATALKGAASTAHVSAPAG